MGREPANTRARGLTADDRIALRAYWEFFAPRSLQVWTAMRRHIETVPEWQPFTSTRTEAEIQATNQQNEALQKAAVVDGDWGPYLDDLAGHGRAYARMGLSHAGWYDVFTSYRGAIHRMLFEMVAAEPASGHTALLVARGLDLLLDIATETIGNSYLAGKEAELIRSEERYRSMFEQSPLPMWTFDRTSLRFLDVNEAAIRRYGYSRAEFLAMTIADIRPPEDVAAMRQDVASARGVSGSRIWRHLAKDGSIILAEIEGNDIVVDNVEVRLILVHDVTARERAQEALRRTEDQLRHAQKMDAIGRLAGGVAHDFNNVLTVIASYAAMLERSLDSGDVRHDDAREIRRAADRAAAITRQLLTLSRHGVAAARSIDLDDVVTGLVPLLRRLIGEQVSLSVHRGGVPPVIADPGLMEQVLMNLVANARDAMPGGGRLTIETAVVDIEEGRASHGLRTGPHVMVAVTDTGTGMSPDVQRHIFDPFYTTKEVGKGTGLGLAIVHGIVTQAGGAVTVYSEPGHGTTVRFFLPAADGDVDDSADEPVAAPEALPAITVLVVDDDREVRGVASRVLRDAGCDVIEAATSDEARRLCAEHDGPLDLALVDVVLGDGRGDALASHLREQRPSLQVILMSGYAAGALGAGGATPPRLLAKPFTPSELRAAVARAADAQPPSAEPSGTRRAVRDERSRVLVVHGDGAVLRSIAAPLSASGFDVIATDPAACADALATARFDAVVGTGDRELLRAVRRVDLDVPVVVIGDAASAAVDSGAFARLEPPLDLGALVAAVHDAAAAFAFARVRRQALATSGARIGVADHAGLDVRFEQALDRLWLATQPIADARTAAVLGLEVLVRSDEPSMAEPRPLLAAAARLGRHRELARRIRALAATIAARSPTLNLAVNIHPDDVLDDDLLDPAAPLTRHAARVFLELSERAAVAATPAWRARVDALRGLGYRFAIDDVGAGFLGVAAFDAIRPAAIKIDGVLMRDIHLSALKQRTVAALCSLAHQAGMTVVAEAIETIDERDAAVSVGCDHVQGYLIGRPARGARTIGPTWTWTWTWASAWTWALPWSWAASST
jgi:two-component system cell cycle sensor histidine kinase/response regulator CckA